MQKNGLRVSAQDEDFNTPVEAMHLGDLSTVTEPFDLIFLSLKSYDTVWASHMLLPHLKPGGVVAPGLADGEPVGGCCRHLLSPCAGPSHSMGPRGRLARPRHWLLGPRLALLIDNSLNCYS